MRDVRRHNRLASISECQDLRAWKLLRIAELNLKSAYEKQRTQRQGKCQPNARLAKNPAAPRNAGAATTHHNTGRHAYSPTAMPAPNANAAQNNERRGGLIAGENKVATVLGNTSLFVIANRESVGPSTRNELRRSGIRMAHS